MKLFDFINGKKTMIATGVYGLIMALAYINNYFPLPEAFMGFMIGLKPLCLGLGVVGFGHKAAKIEAGLTK